ncbi:MULTISPECIES: hypothetical protein [Enorma]|uniref:hypothetical protein n=1 Tax=Enorma TaxID=1472762 RepID=UPI000348CBDF|nr:MULTISPECIES: hypothetical protein [Enorma]
MSQSTTSQPRTVATVDRGTLDIRNLVLLAILLAAGFILNMTVGKALSSLTMGTLSPEFIIAAFCLEILVVRPKAPQAIVIGLIAGAVIQISASVKGPDLVAEPIAALVMALIVNALMRTKAKAIVPALGTFVTTCLSGLIYAVIVIYALRTMDATLVVMLPVVAGTGVANAIIVAALYLPIKKALKIAD